MKFFTSICILAVLAGAGCSKESSPAGPEQKPTDTDYIALGWSDFDAQKIDSAVNNFTQAYNQASTSVVRGDALSGRGWSYAYKRDLVKSNGDFVFAIGFSEISSAALNDVRAGAAFVAYSLNDFSSAITYSIAVLADNPSYTFSHDAKVTAKRVRLLLAQAYYANGQFSSAAGQLDIFDPARSPHSSDPSILLASITAALNSL
jgi:outer membrane protein assembly factor BamD (BamD/ComL family)